MKDLYTALCAVSFYDADGNLVKEHIVITGVEDFKEAVERAEDWYGKDLASISVTLHCDSYLIIDEKKYNKLMESCV